MSSDNSPIGLIEVLDALAGGQCQGTRDTGEVTRGEIKSSFLPSKKKHGVIIILEWLCIRRSVFDGQEILQERWFMVPQPPSGHHFLNVEYIDYCLENDEGEDEGPVRINGYGEHYLLYDKDDLSNLVRVEDDFKPYHEVYKQELKLGLLTALLTRKNWKK